MRSPFLYKPDPEIERTFSLRRKKQTLEEQRLKVRRTSPNMASGGGEPRGTLRVFVTLRVQGIASSIAHANVEANSIELKSVLISMV